MTNEPLTHRYGMAHVTMSQESFLELISKFGVACASNSVAEVLPLYAEISAEIARICENSEGAMYEIFDLRDKLEAHQKTIIELESKRMDGDT